MLQTSQSESAPQVEAPDPAEIPTVTDAWSMIVGKVDDWIETAITLLPNFVVAVIVMLAFWAVAKIVQSILRRALGHTPIAEAIVNLFVTLGGILINIVGLFVALGILGLDKTVTSLLAGVGIVGLALGFAFQDIAANFISGVIMSFRKPARPGDLIETNGFFGSVDEINLRSTVLRVPTGQLVYLPNKQVFENPIINFTLLGQRRVDLNVGVSYGDDLAKAKKLALEALDGVKGRVDGREAELFYEEFGDSSINFVVRFWIDFSRQAEFLAARSDAIMAIKAAFDQNDITIPFPIRTLDFGIVGGQPLSEAFPPQLVGRGG